MATVQEALHLADQHLYAGRLAEAEAIYRQILGVQPNHVGVLHNLGLIAVQTGRLAMAEELIRKALGLDAGNAIIHCSLGEVYRTQGRPQEAMESYQRALQLRPGYPEAASNLGLVLADQGRLSEAAAACRSALQSRPDFAPAHNILGKILGSSGDFAQAIASFQQALAIQPHFAEAWNNLGVTYHESGQAGPALEALQRAAQLNPNAPEIHNNLGRLLGDLDQLDEAIAAYRRALDLHPHFPDAYNGLAQAFNRRGQVDEAIAALRQIVQGGSSFAGAHSNLIYTLHFHPAQDAALIAEEQRRWNAHFLEPLRSSIASHTNTREPDRRLRIGLVSPDFCQHVIGRNVLPYFEQHDPANFEIYCYSEVARPDRWTDLFRQHADHWRPITGLSDEALANLIRQDAVDVLVDLTQHMAGNRLTMFARQPAPVQASFAGYPAGTGVETIHYRLSDRFLENGPSSGERVFLLDSFWCYATQGMDIPVNPLPASTNGHITFGALNNLTKVNEPLLESWARILGAVKGSRLLLLGSRGSHRQRITDFLQRLGVESHRVEFLLPCRREEYLRYHQRIDLILDSFPYNGHTTSLDALWMGVPVVSLAGNTSVSRGGLSILSNLALAELVARSADDYVRVAVDLATDLPRLATLRASLRSRMEASVLMDASRFADSIEDAFRSMWREWCQEHRA
ncbi:Tetratricopeptide TPR_2 repeat protein [Chthoniobacter flavus Ellin428]|uniref:protein O-GlcNAc transferase n=1 Tax=Chthoniobacter flavus Ellin428 TaxID=497964 RepID=B4D1C9_9BACT|nr:tetratricopeptide repeat protein [Chthoniobacter flavus]EDY19541.1 Tetratricopeptide TPR_2 repeat protein [Chthoniobacter flavus Ellin428]TCO92785.1 putative O-linked N-acetylglucosamine transferase (SPINDLY family) [Chthoniobacter flavus]